jgi:NAD(P)H-hydrate epimerase
MMRDSKQIQKFNSKCAAKLLPQRHQQANKTAGGKSLVIGGSQGYWGAAVLCATAAARTGSGYVTLMTDLKKIPFYKFPDLLTADLSRPKKSLLKQNAIAIGPGLGTGSKTHQLLKLLLKLKFTNVVVDADALSVCAKKNIFPLPETWILTPHEGELARLLEVSARTIRKDRKKYLQMAQKKYSCVILLKGHRSLIANSKKIYEIQTGNNSLAKAGTGDVLTGIITGFLAQGLTPLDAALVGTTVHGKIADDWINQKNDHLSLLASDLLERLPQTIFRLRKK